VRTHEDTVRRWYREVWTAGGDATVHELMADDIEGHMEGTHVRGRDQFLAERERLLQAFPDLAIVVDDVIAQGDKVAIRWHVNGTHRGDGLGFAASHRPVAFRGMTWMEFRDGRIVAGWDSWNMGGVLQALLAP
jgi:steroid delta-isomerase-like uncharacterized protein